MSCSSGGLIRHNDLRGFAVDELCVWDLHYRLFEVKHSLTQQQLLRMHGACLDISADWF